MRSSHYRFGWIVFALITSCVIYLSVQPVHGDWPMFHNDAQRTGKSTVGGPLVPALKWSYETGAPITSSPSLSYNDVYVGSKDRHLYGFDLNISSPGTLKWSYETGGDVNSSAATVHDYGFDSLYVG